MNPIGPFKSLYFFCQQAGQEEDGHSLKKKNDFPPSRDRPGRIALGAVAMNDPDMVR